MERPAILMMYLLLISALLRGGLRFSVDQSIITDWVDKASMELQVVLWNQLKLIS